MSDIRVDKLLGVGDGTAFGPYIDHRPADLHIDIIGKSRSRGVERVVEIVLPSQSRQGAK